MHWNDPNICDASHSTRWKWWSAIAAIRMTIYSAVVGLMHIFKPWLDEHPRRLARATGVRNIVDALGLVWFIVGNIWLFGDDTLLCKHPQDSQIYCLCVAIIVINYIQICLPCILAILLIPLFCFCMPCLIRILARLQVTRATVVR